MYNVIVAVACNLVAALVLVGAILVSIRDGVRVTLTKFILTL